MDFFQFQNTESPLALASVQAAEQSGSILTSDSGYASGFMQQLASLGTGYLSKRLDVDIQRRIAGSMPYPQQWGLGAEVYYTQAGVRPGQMPQRVGFDMGGLLPWLLIGGVVFLVARKR